MTFQVIAVTGLIFAVIALIIGIIALIYVVGVRNSTHQVQYMPIDPNETMPSTEIEKLLGKEALEFEEDQL